MSVEENKALIRRYFDEVVNSRNLAAMGEIFAPSFSYQDYERSLVELLDAFPDLQATIEEIVAEGDTVAVHWVDRGTHQGTWKGVRPTGKSVTLTGSTVFRIANGQVIDAQGDVDFAGLVRQIRTGPIPGDIVQQAHDRVAAVLQDTDQDGVPDVLEDIVPADALRRRAAPEDRLLRLQEAKGMLDAGLITAEEYEATKAQILAEM